MENIKVQQANPFNRIICKNTKDSHKELAINRNKIYPSPISTVDQCLSTNYINQDSRFKKIAFFDIEADFDPEKGSQFAQAILYAQ